MRSSLTKVLSFSPSNRDPTFSQNFWSWTRICWIWERHLWTSTRWTGLGITPGQTTYNRYWFMRDHCEPSDHFKVVTPKAHINWLNLFSRFILSWSCLMLKHCKSFYFHCLFYCSACILSFMCKLLHGLLYFSLVTKNCNCYSKHIA